jgi:maltooligosyltrehalose trehalohydrolase
VPDPQAEETFARSKLRWEEIGEGDHADMLDWYRRLIALRHQEPALTCGKLERVQVTFDETKKWLWMSRGPIEVVFNAGNDYLQLPVAHRYEVLLASGPGVSCDAERVCLPGGSAAVLRGLSTPRTG